jgi:hypothetical protein
MSIEPEIIDFHKRPDLEGIFSTTASGGCVVVAFLYGGKKGQPLKAASLVHVPGGNPPAVNWTKMCFDDHTPSTIVIFLSNMNSLGGPEEERFASYLNKPLNYARGLILAHRTSYTVDHGVDKWGNFGGAFAQGRCNVNSGHRCTVNVEF